MPNINRPNRTVKPVRSTTPPFAMLMPLDMKIRATRIATKLGYLSLAEYIRTLMRDALAAEEAGEKTVHEEIPTP